MYPEHISSGKHELASARNLVCFLPSFELALLHRKVCFDMQYTLTKHVLCNCAFHYTVDSLCSPSVGIDKTIMCKSVMKIRPQKNLVKKMLFGSIKYIKQLKENVILKAQK